MRIKGLLFFLVILSFLSSFAQQQNPVLDYGFIRHLMNQNMYEEAVFCLRKQLTNTNEMPRARIDSINHLMGMAYYERKELRKSIDAWMNVSQNSPFYHHARYFTAYNQFYQNKVDSGIHLLKQLDEEKQSLLTELKHFELAGGALLKKDYHLFDEYADQFTQTFYQIETEQEMLLYIGENMQSFNQKSMALAGIMSTIVPGLGKAYTGKFGEGLSSFLTIAILGGITTENYLKDGWKSPKTLLFGSLFSIFYFGNIYGSMISVKVYRNEFYESQRKKILFHLHIPLRTVFQR
jgi:hypothetical protein